MCWPRVCCAAIAMQTGVWWKQKRHDSHRSSSKCSMIFIIEIFVIFFYIQKGHLCVIKLYMVWTLYSWWGSWGAWKLGHHNLPLQDYKTEHHSQLDSSVVDRLRIFAILSIFASKGVIWRLLGLWSKQWNVVFAPLLHLTSPQRNNFSANHPSFSPGTFSIRHLFAPW